MKKMISDLFEKLSGTKLAPLVQFIKFGLVGVSNTLISYGTEMLCYYVIFKNSSLRENMKIIVVTAIAFFVSVTNSYYWNNRYVFKSNSAKTAGQHIRSYLKTVLCYGITGLLLSPVLKVVLSNLGIPYWATSLVTLIITIPLNYLMNKYWAFSDKKGKKA